MSRVNVVLPAAVVVGLVASAAAYSTFLGGGPSPDPFVVGGGHFGPGTSTTGLQWPVPRDFSVDSHVEKKGLKTYGIIRYGNNQNANPSGFLIEIGCVNIQGNRAAVGGTLRGFEPAQGWVFFFVDNGPPGGPKDQVSLPVIEALDPSLQGPGFAGWPAGFPSSGNCPSPTEGPGATAYTQGFFDLDGGDVIVSPGSS